MTADKSENPATGEDDSPLSQNLPSAQRKQTAREAFAERFSKFLRDHPATAAERSRWVEEITRAARYTDQLLRNLAHPNLNVKYFIDLAEEMKRRRTETSNAEAREELVGWKDICKTVHMEKKDKRRLRTVNERESGPIKTFGRGVPPRVMKDDLISWWNNLEERIEERRRNQESKRATFLRDMVRRKEDSYVTGRKAGKVFGINSVHEKERRKDRGQSKKKGKL